MANRWRQVATAIGREYEPMLLNLAMIVLGIVMMLWAEFLLPRQMRQVSARARGRAKERYDELTRQSIIARLVVAPTIMGSILIMTGLVLWLTE
jgi:hypothetical protein